MIGLFEAPKFLDQILAGGDLELVHGDCAPILAAMEPGSVDAVITDPPYGDRTHAGHDASAGEGQGRYDRSALGYASLMPHEAEALARDFARISRAWVVVFSCSDLAHVWRGAFAAAGMQSFAPVIDYRPGSTVRLAGDGPSSWATYINVARHRGRALSKWGTLPGGYTCKHRGGGKRRTGGKPYDLMHQIVKDYSREGDMVIDPFMGFGTTGSAALAAGRKFAGIEIDAEAFASARSRLIGEGRKVAGQVGLFS